MASIHNEILIEAAPEQTSAAVRDVDAVHQRLVPGQVVDPRLGGVFRIPTVLSGGMVHELIPEVLLAYHDISALLGIDPRVLLAVEVPGLPKKATLLTYLRYAEFLVVCRDLDRLKTEKLVA